MPPSRYVRLTDEEDERLRQIEQDAYLNPKVRLRAQVLRLSARGESAQRIASYPRVGVARTKQLFHDGLDSDFASATSREEDAELACFRSVDTRERLRAFVDRKRQ